MNQFKPYPVYKDSGVEWLGTAPSDWSLKRLGDIVAFAQGKAHEPYIDDDGDYICVNSRFVSTSGKTTKNCSVNLTPASLNDILMVMSDLPNGRALARAYYVRDSGKYAVNQRVCRITAEKAHSWFLFYLLDRHPSFMQNDDGVNQTHLSNDDFQRLKLYLPSPTEQIQIARFLDHETARIDVLIEEQQRLIALLKEKRQAVISHAVTKGLDPMVPMKDSGVEWLGEVPAHWTVCKLSIRYSVELGKMLDEKRNTGANPVPYLRNQDVQWGSINTDDLPFLDISPSEFDRYTVKNGDLLVCEGGDVGRSAIWRHTDCLTGYQKALHRLRPEAPSRDTPEFIFYSLMAAKYFGVFEESDTKATIAHLPAEKFRQYRFAFPPLDDQQKIAAALGSIVCGSSDANDYATKTIGLLKERRSALISAAVTGKIDVRDWQPPAGAKAQELEKVSM